MKGSRRSGWCARVGPGAERSWTLSPGVIGRALGLALVGGLLAGCATARVVPVPAAGVGVEAGQSTVASVEGVQIVVRPSSWEGAPAWLPGYVTPVHLLVINGSAFPLSYGYGDLRLFDEARFQYTAIPPVDVGQLLRWGEAPPELRVAAATRVPLHWRRSRFRDPFWGDPWWWGPPFPYYYPPPRIDDVLAQALPVGTVQATARVQGFAYFPRLRQEATRLTFEFHYRLGESPRVLSVPLAVVRAEGRALRLVATPR